MKQCLFFLLLSVTIALLSVTTAAEVLPKVEFSVKDFPQVSEWEQHLGDISYISHKHDDNGQTKIYNSNANMPAQMLPPLYNDNRASFSGKFSSFSSTNNTRLLEALLAKGYHLNAYVHLQKSAQEYTIVGYDREQKNFTVRTHEGKEQQIAYADLDIQYIDVKTENLTREWLIAYIDESGQPVYQKEITASSIGEAIRQTGNRKGKVFMLLQGTPMQAAGWSGENKFDQMVQFGGNKYNAFDEKVITIYISQNNATGCHMTRYTTGGKGDGYSDNVLSGNVYCFSTNPVAVNKAAGLARFVLRCKVKKNGPTPWWVKAEVYYRLFTPN